jgi:hypothetical protein
MEENAMPRKILIIVCLMGLLLGITLGCNLISGIQGDIGAARDTAEAIATEARGITTQVEGFATEIDASSRLATLEALVTQERPEAEATLKALGTQAAESGIYQTAEAYVTEEGPNLLATIQAIATQGLPPNNPPDDIPIVDQGNISFLFANESTVSYLTDLDYQTVLSSTSRMPANGWDADHETSVESGYAAVLRFEKHAQPRLFWAQLGLGKRHPS